MSGDFDMGLVRLGLVCAAKLGVPLTVAGREVMITEDEAKALIPDDAVELTDAAIDVVATNYSPQLELGRRIIFAMHIATRFLERTGLKTGDIAPAPEPKPSQDERIAEMLEPPEPELIESPDGSVAMIGKFTIAKGNDGPDDWIVRRHHDSMILSHWPDREIARRWALRKLEENPALFEKPEPPWNADRLTWPRRRDVPAPPTIIGFHPQQGDPS